MSSIMPIYMIYGIFTDFVNSTFEEKCIERTFQGINTIYMYQYLYCNRCLQAIKWHYKFKLRLDRLMFSQIIEIFSPIHHIDMISSIK